MKIALYKVCITNYALGHECHHKIGFLLFWFVFTQITAVALMEFGSCVCLAVDKNISEISGRKFFSIFCVRSCVQIKTENISRFHDCQISYLCINESAQQKTKSVAFFSIVCPNATVCNIYVISHIFSISANYNTFGIIQRKFNQRRRMNNKIDVRCKEWTQSCQICCLIELDHHCICANTVAQLLYFMYLWREFWSRMERIDRERIRSFSALHAIASIQFRVKFRNLSQIGMLPSHFVRMNEEFDFCFSSDVFLDLHVLSLSGRGIS